MVQCPPVSFTEIFMKRKDYTIFLSGSWTIDVQELCYVIASRVRSAGFKLFWIGESISLSGVNTLSKAGHTYRSIFGAAKYSNSMIAVLDKGNRGVCSLDSCTLWSSAVMHALGKPVWLFLDEDEEAKEKEQISIPSVVITQSTEGLINGLDDLVSFLNPSPSQADLAHGLFNLSIPRECRTLSL